MITRNVETCRCVFQIATADDVIPRKYTRGFVAGQPRRHRPRRCNATVPVAGVQRLDRIDSGPLLRPVRDNLTSDRAGRRPPFRAEVGRKQAIEGPTAYNLWHSTLTMVQSRMIGRPKLRPVASAGRETASAVSGRSDASRPVPGRLEMPPTQSVDPPVQTLAQTLPVAALRWEDFERLCLRLARLNASVEYCQLYGVRGQKQEGIDLYARSNGGGDYAVYQCKRVARFGPGAIESAVRAFRRGTWFERASALYICTSDDGSKVRTVEEFERQQRALRRHGKSLVLWDVGELSRALKNEPLIVDDFFGRHWTNAFCGEPAATALGGRLDAAAVVAFRSRLRSFYTDVFNGHDPGIPIPPRPGKAPIPLQERYVLPDVLVSQIVRSSTSSREPSEIALSSQPDRRSATAAPSIQREREQLTTWLAKADHSIILGAPGSGKSSFLRYLALDLLCDEPQFEELAHRWGQRLPVWIPFAFWCQQVSSGAEPSLRECVRRWLSQWSMNELFPLVDAAIQDHRLLLLVDGIDEWTSEDAGRIVSHLLQGFATLHRAAVVVTSRPYGLQRISFTGASWQVAELAPLSARQREELCRQWFLLKATRDVSEREEIASASATYATREAERLTAELARSSELAPLSTVPLLLLLLIFMRFQRTALPRGRFDAYDGMLDHVLREHPKAKRVAASITDDGDLLDEVSTRQALANLAFVVQREHPDGVIADAQFELVVHAFLTDRADTGLGLSPVEANRYLPQFSRLAEGTLGVLIRQGTHDLSFIHRSFQEYLAAEHLARLPVATQEQILESHCRVPQWREVILGLFSKMSRPDDVRRLVEVIEPHSDESVSGLAVRELLAEIAFGEFGVPPDVVDRVTAEALTRIERHFWLPHRQRLLTSALDGLRSTRLRERVHRRIRRWVFDRGVWSDWSDPMSRWPYDENVVSGLISALHSESAHIQRGASRALAGLATNVPAVGDIMASLATAAASPLARAAALNGLHQGWPAHLQLDSAIKHARESICGELRLTAIGALVHRAEHVERDLEELLALGDHDNQWELDYAWRSDVAELLTLGWPANPRLKEICLKATNRWMTSDGRLERKIAWEVLLRAFPGDLDVSQRCVDEINHEDHPFSGAHLGAWKAIATNFRDDAAIGAAIETWASREKYVGLELSHAALVTRPDTIKSILVRGLSGSFPHWPVKALLDGWGMGDEEVSAALIRVALGAADRATNIATEIPRILVDQAHARARLLELIADPKCDRPDFVIKGLASLTSRGDEAELADKCLRRLGSDEPSGALVDGGADQLIEFFGNDSAVRAYAVKSLDWRQPPLAAAAVALADIPEARLSIVDRIGHLPTLLRRQIVEGLSTSTDEEFAQSVLHSYDVEANGELKTSAAVAYFSRIDPGTVLASTAAERLGRNLRVVGPDYDERRQAAFAALTTIKRLDVMVPLTEHIGEVRPLAISLGHHHQPNLPLLRVIAQNWQSIKDAFGDSASSRLAGHLSAPFWQSMALVARESIDVRDALLEAVNGDSKLARTPEVLLLRANIQPRSLALRDACINALDESGRQQWEFDSVDEAADILGEQFGADSETLSLLKKLDPSFRNQGVILSLCAGWPESPELASVFEAFTGGDRHLALNYPTMFALKYTCTPAGDLVKTLDDDLRRGTQFILPLMVKPIRRRLARDRDAQEAFESVINDDASPTAKATTIRLLAIAAGLNDQLRAWSELEVRRQLAQVPAPELAFDLISNSVRALADSLLDALSGPSAGRLMSSS